MVRNCGLFCIESLYAYARTCTVTLINLPFIEVVFVYISPYNGGRVGGQQAPLTRVGRPSAGVTGTCQQSHKSYATETEPRSRITIA